MRIWHICDIHDHQEFLMVRKDIDMVICSGDICNSKDLYFNEQETNRFIDWFSKLDIEYKIFVAGNHDIAISKKKKYYKKVFKDNNIIYLEDQSIEIEGIKILGSPYTPTYGIGWVFTKSREKLYNHWQKFKNYEFDILVTHGPPKNILDLTISRTNDYEVVGDNSLLNFILDKKPILSMFGHIHNTKNVINSGIKKIPNLRTIFSNAAIVEDGKFNKIVSNGNYFEIIDKQVKIYE